MAHRPYSEHIAEFADHMLRDRGVSPRTAENCCAMDQDFLARIAEDGLRLETLTVAEVDEMLIAYLLPDIRNGRARGGRGR